MKKAKVIIPICFAVLSTPAFAKAVHAAEAQAAAPMKTPVPTAFQQQYVDVNPNSYLNLRKSPSTNALIIDKLARGTEVTILSVQNGWAKVKVNGKEGYVSTTYLSAHNIQAAIPQKTTAKYVNVDPGSRLNFRQGPSLNAPILSMLSRGTKVNVISESGGWAKVEVNGKEGYVSAKYLSVEKPPVVEKEPWEPVLKRVSVNADSHLNVRKNPSTTSAVIAKLKNGTEITVYSEEYGWAKVKVNGQDGYVSTKYLTAVPAKEQTEAQSASAQTKTSTPIDTKIVSVNPGSNLNLRKSPSTSAPILAKLANGTRVDVYSESGGWAKVKANGKEGYVSTAYLKNEQQTDNGKTEKVTATKIVSVDPGSNLNLRRSPSTAATILAKLPNGTKVDVYYETNGWAKVKAKGMEGYVSTAYLINEQQSDNGKTEKVIATKFVSVNPGSNLNLRKSPSTSAAILAKLPNGTKVDVYSESGGWAKVKANGKEGYVSTTYLKNTASENNNPPAPEPGTVTKYVNVNPGSHLNLRKGPGVETTILDKLPNGTMVTVYSEKDGWAKVKVNGKQGYVSTLYLSTKKPVSEQPKPAPAEVTKFVSVNPGSNLHLRKGPSTSAAILAKLPNGTKVTVYSESGGWAKVKANGIDGYVSTEFLSDKKPDSAITTEVMYVDVDPGSHLNMRNKPSLDGSVIVKLARGVEVTVYEVKNGWAKIKVYGQEGYVSTEFLSATKPGTNSGQQPLPEEPENPGNDPGQNDGGNNPGQNDGENPETPPGNEPNNPGNETGDGGTNEPGPGDEPGDGGNDEQEPGDGNNNEQNPGDGDQNEPDPSEETEVTPPEQEPGDENPGDNTVIKIVNVNPGSNLNLRTGPSTSTAIITRLPAGTQVIVHFEQNGWAYVTVNGYTGYVNTQYLLDLPDPGKEAPGEKITIVYQEYDMTLDEFLAIQMKANPQTDHKYAVFIRSDALKVDNPANPTSGIVQGTGWRVRGGAGTEHWIVGNVNNGEKLEILSVVEGSDGYDWYQINYRKTWVNPKPEDVRYYLDPDNFTKTKADSFQFLKLSALANVDPFELNEYVLAGKGVLAGHGATFVTAAKKYGINEMYLISHALLETGNGKSVLAQGVEIYGKTVYNMYGIGATDSNPIANGAKFAYEAGWFTPEAAIIGGAEFIARNYIFAGQDTLYKMRWNPNGAVATGKATHQYATDIGWAAKQVHRIFSLYEQLNTYQVILEIPKFKN